MYILRTREEKLFGWVDTSDKLNLITALLNKTPEDIQKDTFEHVQDFVVMLMDLHFQIKTDELVMLVVPTAMMMGTYLSHVSWRIRVLCSEDGSNALRMLVSENVQNEKAYCTHVNSLPPTSNFELLVELRTLG